MVLINFKVFNYHYQPCSFVKGNTKTMKNQYVRCAVVDTDLKLWSVECKNGKENYMWGNAVKITTDAAKMLHLCEVEVYAETYGEKQLIRHMIGPHDMGFPVKHERKLKVKILTPTN